MKSRDLLRTGEVADALGVSVNTIKAWARRGLIDMVRLPSGHHRVPRREVERLLAARPGALSRRQEAFELFEAWRREQPSQHPPLSKLLEWNEAARRIAESQGKLPEASLEEKADRVAHLKRALAALES